MQPRIVLLSYAIVVVSAVSILSVGFLGSQGYPYYSPFFLFGGYSGPLLGLFIVIFAVSGLVLGPYFALAGLIVKDSSVWVEANRMLHAHISFPLLSGLVLLSAAINASAFSLVLPGYLAMVFSGTLISAMAAKKSKPKPVPTPASNPPTSLVSN